MSFWGNVDIEENKSGSFEMGGGPAIPDNTNAKACIENAEWKSWEGSSYINLQWCILEGQFKGRKVFQRIKVFDFDDNKKEKALKMLLAIDHNCGGKIAQLKEAPEDHHLNYLCDKPMIIKIMKWEIDGKQGNWISKVAPLSDGIEPATADNMLADKTDADIPF